MSFLYPLFLVAGLSLAVPVLIHLFNLRRYRTVQFPHTRFLKNIQLQSQKQNKVRNKWLLLTRLLFLAALVLAFAQPLFRRSTTTGNSKRLQVIYLDNSYSMTVKKGAVSLLELARQTAGRQVKNSNASYLLLTNDKPISYQPLPAERVYAEIQNIEASPAARNNEQVLSLVQSLVQSEAAEGADLYYYSDFQKNSFGLRPDAALLRNIVLHGTPLQAEAYSNVYIDTALLSGPVLQTGESNYLIVRSRLAGQPPKEAPVLQLSVNGQVKSAATLSFEGKTERSDTLSFLVNNAGWQQIVLSINDASVRYDDTFRIAARSAPALSVLVLNEAGPNPYIQAAFRSYKGFRVEQGSTSAVPTRLDQYNLIILNGLTRLSDAAGKSLSAALSRGQSLCVFPGATRDLEGLNQALGYLAAIRAEGIDTAAQTLSTLQQGSDLVRDLFEQVPPNVQLPVVNSHYRLSASLEANQQSVMSFRNGDPFLAQYSPGRGKLYLCAASADLESGNFPNSYFFVPFLYQMAAQSRSGDVLAISAGFRQPVFLPLVAADERRIVHLKGQGLDVIPPQRSNGTGLDVFIEDAVQQPGFYLLSAGNNDSVQVALNASRSESIPEVWTPATLRSDWAGDKAQWLEAAQAGRSEGKDGGSGFPLWKVCAILALAALAAETILLVARRRQSLPTAS